MSVVDILLNPNGRISRLTFWGAVTGLGVMVLAAVYGLTRLSEYLLWQGRYEFGVAAQVGQPLTMGLILCVPVLWMAFCLVVKRWHDRGRSGWWLIVPLIGQVWALIECTLFEGTRSGNKYGPSPKRSELRSFVLDEDIPEDMA